MKKLSSFLIGLLTFLFITGSVNAQSTANYTYSSASNGSLALDKNGNSVDMSTGTTQLYGSGVDSYTAVLQNLGFNFVFMGTLYTQFSASPDGAVRLGSTLITGHTVSPTASTPFISCINIDNKTGGTGKVHYKVQSGTGGQVLIIEWKDILINWNAAGTTLSTFQLRLYQASGTIEMVYGQMWNSSTSAQTGVVWFGSSNTTNTVGQLNTITTTPTYSSSATSLTTTSFALSSAMTNLNSSSDGSRTVFTFTPPAAQTAPTWQTPTSVTGTSMQLNWTDNSSSETGFAILRSTDGINYTYVTTTAANASNYSATGLNFGITYYWQIYAVNEGVLSSAASGSQATLSPTLSGTKYVGTGSNPTDYATLTDAFTAINNNGLSANLNLVLNTTYTTTDASFPIVGPSALAVGTYTVTVYPSVTGLSITSASTTGTINLNGSKNVIFDGRVDATGSTKDLIISNTNLGTSYAVQFINDATGNTLKYCKIHSRNNSTTSGTIVFSTTTGTNGNDNNTIDNCDIYDGTTTPFNGIYSSGTTTSTAHNNSNNTISNCNLYNFFNATGADNGILISSGNTDWTITGNSLYQTTSRTMTTAATDNGISISNTSGNNFVITNNYIGGGSANCGGSAWTILGSVANRFRGISLSIGSTTASSIQGNTISNFSFTSNSSASTVGGGWVGIILTSGNANIGTVTGNTIGSGTGTGSISITMLTNSGGISSGIWSDAASSTISISNNTIGSMTQASSTIGAGLIGIAITAGTSVTINNNIVGSTTTSNSFNTGAYTGASVVAVTGIRNTSSATTLSITNNTVANLNNGELPSSASTVNFVMGISSNSGTNTITGNTVRNLSTAANATGTGASASVIGISLTSTTAGTTLSQNTIYGLSSTHSLGAVCVTGIHYGGATTGTNIVARNFVYGLNIVSTSISSDMRGINFASGLVTAYNNMIRLGYDASGTALTTGISITGLCEVTTTSNTAMYHNSVYIGGTGVGTGAGNTFAFSSSQTTNNRIFQNNIFVNSRSNATSGGTHYAVRVAGTGVNPTGLTCNNNLFYANGTGGKLGVYGSDCSTLDAWRTATGQDYNSGYGDPNYVSPTTATPDLHVQSPTPIEASGTNIASVTVDFDGETRSGLTPVDIGADAGNFTGSDVFPPSISYTALGNGSTSNRVITNFATITDNVGVSSGASAPRLYYKKSTDADAFVGNTSSDNGWKYVVGTGPSPYSFTIDYGIINGGSVSVSDVIQYFVVAQDDANNLGSLPGGATASGNPPVQNINGKATTPNTYTITPTYSGSYNVPGSYATLTGTGGLFATLNSGVVTGNITVNITNDITEDGTNALNQWSEEGVGGYTLTIQPDAASMRTISGAVANGMIRLNGADRVTIDGRYSGSGRYLTFRNTNTSNSTFTFLNDASSNTIRSSIIEGSTTLNTNGVVFISSGAVTTGNDNNTITDNQIRDRSDAAGVPANLIYSAGFSGTITNTGNTISNNEMFNFTINGINCTSTGNENWTISGNIIYQGAARTTALTGVLFNSLGTNTISQNTIRDLNTNSTYVGINLGNAYGTTVSRNKIYQTSVAGSGSSWTGVTYNGGSGLLTSVTLTNNQITLIPTTSNTQSIYGIRDFGFSGNVITLYYNSVYIGGTASGSATWAIQRGTSTPTTFTAKNNIFFNNRTGGSVNHYACGDQSHGTGTFSVSNNLYAGTGTTAANYMDRSATAESFSAWVTAKGDNTSYGSIASGITYSDLFTDVTTGDLNIRNDNSVCWNVKGKGTALTGQADDYGATGVRSTTVAGGSTCIGSDEFTTSVPTPSASSSGSPTLNGTTNYTVSGRTVTSILWGPGGTVPSSIDVVYYSGTNPPNSTGFQVGNCYWTVTATGGAGFSYNITLTYDESQLGGINSEGDIRLTKSEDGVTYTSYLTPGTDPGQYSLNTTNNTITVYGLSTFSYFGITDNDAPLPVQLASFNASVDKRNVNLKWSTSTETNNKGFEIERKEIAGIWSKIGYVDGNGNSTTVKNYSFEDRNLTTGKYNYRLKQIDNNGNYEYHALSKVVEVGIPTKFDLSQNYPNPFNPVTKIDFALPLDAKVSIKIYDMTGREVKTIVNEQRTAGYYTVQFNGSDLSSGVYFYRIMTKSSGADYIMTKKMVLVK